MEVLQVGMSGRKGRGKRYCEYRQEERLQQFTTMSRDSEAGKSKETCSYHRLLKSLLILISLGNLGVGDVKKGDCGKTWIGYLFKMYKCVNKFCCGPGRI